MTKPLVCVSAIQLRFDGPNVVVYVEQNGNWYEVIAELRDAGDGTYHIAEAQGIIRQCTLEPAKLDV